MRQAVKTLAEWVFVAVRVGKPLAVEEAVGAHGLPCAGVDVHAWVGHGVRGKIEEVLVVLGESERKEEKEI